MTRLEVILEPAFGFVNEEIAGVVGEKEACGRASRDDGARIRVARVTRVATGTSSSSCTRIPADEWWSGSANGCRTRYSNFTRF